MIDTHRMYPALRLELLRLAAEDARVREELAADGSLFEGYHPRMEAVHKRNAARLREIIAQHGWPTNSLVGKDGGEAAWLIAQHAIGEPAFMRSCLEHVRTAIACSEAPAWMAAMLEDRIRMYEGKPQVYGTQLESDPEGRLRPYLIENSEAVDERRATVGLEPLGARLTRAQTESHEPPKDRERFETDYRAWLRRVGWRD